MPHTYAVSPTGDEKPIPAGAALTFPHGPRDHPTVIGRLVRVTFAGDGDDGAATVTHTIAGREEVFEIARAVLAVPAA